MSFVDDNYCHVSKRLRLYCPEKKAAYDNSWVVCNDSRESVNLQRQISELPEELAAEGGIEIHQSAADPKDDMEFYLNVATSDSNGNLLINFFATEMAEQY